MNIELLRAKIHRLTVTESDVNYVGSITLDEDLIDAAGLFAYEKVHVANVTNGNRFNTYVMKGKRGSGMVCINGAAAHRATKGDVVIVFAYASMDMARAQIHKPVLVFVDKDNKAQEIIT